MASKKSPVTAGNRLIRRNFSAVRASFLSGVVDRIESKGNSAQPLLNRVGINPALLGDAYAEIPLAQFVGFLEEAAFAVEDLHLGAQIGTELTAGDMGPVGIILSLSASIHTGMERFVRYANVLQGETDIHWIDTGADLVFTYGLSDDAIWPRRQDAEFSLSVLTTVLRNNFSSRWSPKEVHFEHAAPSAPEDLQKIFRCPVKYAQPRNRIIAAKEDCVKQLRKEDKDLMAALERHVKDLIGAQIDYQNFRQAVIAVIDANIGLTPINLTLVAKALGTSPRSVQRKLAQEGTSLRALLEERRAKLAHKLLSEPGARVLNVAEALGYSDPTAFWRAYKGWTGRAPSDHKTGQQ